MAPSLAPWGVSADDITSLDEIASWYRARAATRDAAQSVSDRTWRDLDGDRLFRTLDHTATPLGRQRLYATLREPPSPSDRELLEHLAEACTEDAVFRERLRDALAGHHGVGGYRLWQLLDEPTLTTPGMRLAPIATIVLVLLLLLLPFAPKVIIAVVPLAFAGLAVRLFGLSRAGGYIGPLREIAPVLRAARSLSRTLAAHPRQAHFQSVISALVPAERELAPVGRWAQLVNPTLVSSSELLSSLYEYVNLVFLLDLNALVFVGRALERHRAALESVCVAVGRVDVACSIASFRITSTWCRPTWSPDGDALAFTALRHPMLPQGIPNDVTLRSGEGLLLTGANMSGKSTLLRALGTNVLLGRALGTCTAEQAILPVSQVFTCIGHADDLERGVSYFYAEAEAVAEVLQQAGETRALVLFDELFRGTNAAERLAAAEMTLRHVVVGSARTGGQFVAIATHDLQLADLLGDGFRTAHLTVVVSESALQFGYRLADGPARTRTALALLRQLGVPAPWLADAATRAAALEG